MIRIAKAFADPTRLRILAAVRMREVCVCELVDGLHVTQSTLSTHLQVLRRAGLVAARREGKWSYYSLNDQAARSVLGWFDLFAADIQTSTSLSRDARRLEKNSTRWTRIACCDSTAKIGTPKKSRP